MKLNDPFGRMARRHQMAYETMREALNRAGIDTPEAAREVIKKARERALKFLAIGVVVLLLAALLLPQMMPIIIGLAFLLLVWTASSTINGQRYVQRYIDEDIKQ